MVRTIKFTLKYATAAKHRKLDTLRRERQSMTQKFIDNLWKTPGKLDKATMNRVANTQLSYRHKSDCLLNALSAVISTKLSAKELKVPAGKPNASSVLKLSKLVASVVEGKKSFDYVVKISGLRSGKPINIPIKSHKRMKYWLSKPGAKLLQGCVLGVDYLALWIELPDEKPKEGPTLAVDIGVNKMMVDSNGVKYGTDFKEICAKVRRKKLGSKAKRRAQAERECYINKTVKELPWKDIGTLGIEDLKNLKKGKKKNRSKKFRKALAPWVCSKVKARLTNLAQENRVRLVVVDPRNTSRTCPSCKTVAKENRQGEKFKCIKCSYSADADHVGALNILTKTCGNSQQQTIKNMVAEAHCTKNDKCYSLL